MNACSFCMSSSAVTLDHHMRVKDPLPSGPLRGSTSIESCRGLVSPSAETHTLRE